MRCNDCNKFVGLDLGDAEVQSGPDIDESGNITCEARIVRNCAECGTELKEANFSLEGQMDVEGHTGEGHELEAEETSSEATERQDGKPGTPSRYRRSFFGINVDVAVKCSCGESLGNVQLTDEVQASGMDELS